MFLEVIIIITVIVTCAIGLVYTCRGTTKDTWQSSIQDFNVVITGGSRGVGKAVALHYAQKGARIVLTARNEQKLQKIKAKCLSLGARKVSVISLSMGSTTSAKELCNFAINELGHIDTLVLNHASLLNDLTMRENADWKGESDFGDLQEKIQVNYLSHVYIASYMMPYLEKSAGKICVVNSIFALIPAARSNTYAAGKSALHSFFRSLSEELLSRKSSVTISQIYLGPIGTKRILQCMVDKYGKSYEYWQTGLCAEFIIPPKKIAKEIVTMTEKRIPVSYCPSKTLAAVRCFYFLFPSLFQSLCRPKPSESTE